jgi:uncharacterized membrane protein YhaH (DUF805 family)
MSETGHSPALPRYFSWQGRLSRIGIFCQIVGLSFLGLAPSMIIFLLPTGAWSASFIYMAAIGGTSVLAGFFFLTSFPVIKRLHDLGWSGWLFVVFLIPVVGTVLSLALLFRKGTQGPNRCGRDPLASPTPASHLWLWALVPAVP